MKNMKNYKKETLRLLPGPQEIGSKFQDPEETHHHLSDSQKIGQDPEETLHLLPDPQEIGAKFQDPEETLHLLPDPQEVGAKFQEAEAKNSDNPYIFIAEIMELRLTVSELSKEIKEVREVQAHNQDQTAIEHRLRIRSSLSPKPLEYTKRFWKNMKPMDHRYKKSFRDEVVQILKGLDSSLSIDLFDYKKKWTEIEKDVLREIIPVIKKAMDNRFQYTDMELKKVLQNYHRHQRDAYTISTKPLKLKANKQRVGTNNEVSESDIEKAQNEKDMMIRPSKREDSNHVLHVYDKPWRSSVIRKLLRYADEMGEKTQNVKTVRKRWYDDRLYIEENSNPPPDAPKWVILTTYQPE
ncbi:hypothetical protein RhiirA1_401463 [Rhizophagus irregularis]|uniref:Uncharacterized protein n=1 Tax=Rhizophagus irregularis TaxID=588596 RepID=A0A2N0R221_9GLOM|nr:hypothetical protein RhiirA1_401463 [Rhizophagus irregularis]